MKKYKKVLSMIIAFAMLISMAAFADDDNGAGVYDDDYCNCADCPDRECAAGDDDCECDMADCSSEDCREEALERDDDPDDRYEDKYDICECADCPDSECAAGYDDCDCELAECTSVDCREDAARRERQRKKSEKVKDYGVFEGDPDGNMRVEDSITRAEFAAVVCRMLDIAPGQEDKFDDLDFDDVDDLHWAKDYIKAARRAGIIDGKGNNKFDPEGKISNEEAIKMIVAAMGYAPKAEQKGGYPYGYVDTAAELGVTNELQMADNAEAVRGDIMEMIYNSLDIPMMVEKAYGDKIEYEIADGTNGEEKTIRIILEIKVTQ